MFREGTKIASYIGQIFPPEDLPNYYVKKVIGKGSYGHVARAINKTTQEIVAIKKITNLFVSLPETRRILRQIILLKSCRHPNIVQLLDVIIPKTQSFANFTDLYLITEYCDTDMSKIFGSDSNFITLEQVKQIYYQLLCGIKYLHSANIIHRDLKPANVLINTKGLVVKICDFGLSRIINAQEDDFSQEELEQEGQITGNHFLDPPKSTQPQTQPNQPRKKKTLARMGTGIVHISKEQSQIKAKKLDKHELKTNKLTLRVTTRWYRAPQIILLETEYNKPIDIWAAGCIFGELLKMMKSVCADALQRFPLFPGKYCYPVSPGTLTAVYKNGYPQSKGDQLFMILSAIGKPSEEQLSFLTDEKAKDYVRKIEMVNNRSFQEMFPKIQKQAIQILKSSLHFNPNQRPTIEELLSMKFFDSIRNKDKQSIRDKIDMSLQVESQDITMQLLRQYIIKEIQEFL